MPYFSIFIDKWLIDDYPITIILDNRRFLPIFKPVTILGNFVQDFSKLIISVVRNFLCDLLINRSFLRNN